MTDDLTEVVRPEVMETLVEFRNSLLPGVKILQIEFVPNEIELAQFPQLELHIMDGAPPAFFLINKDYYGG